MTFVSITRLRIRAWRFMPAFALHASRSNAQVRRADGFIGGSLLADRKRTFWTMTLWRDQADMRAYMKAGAHAAAMPRLFGWCDEASVVHWEQQDDAPPSWTEADRRMRGEGRASKVRHPGDAHRALAFDAPRTAYPVPLRPLPRRD